MYISTPPSSEVENFQMKIYYPAGDRTPDPLNQRHTCYHLSQCGELDEKSPSQVDVYRNLNSEPPEYESNVWPVRHFARYTFFIFNVLIVYN